MKKGLTFLLGLTTLFMVSCGSSEEAAPAEEANVTTEEVAKEEVKEEVVELKDHVCGDKCTAEACAFSWRV